MNIRIYTESGELPKYATDGSVGMDLKMTGVDKDKLFSAYRANYSDLDTGVDTTLMPLETSILTEGVVLLPNGGRALLKTGIYVEIPFGFEAQIRLPLSPFQLELLESLPCPCCLRVAWLH